MATSPNPSPERRGSTVDARAADDRTSEVSQDQTTDAGARPELDRDQPDSPTELSKPSLLAMLKRARKE